MTIVVGARPNFIKVAPIINAIHKFNGNDNIIDYRIVHTGQHYDPLMSDTFFEQLNIPKPHTNLGCCGESHAALTANIMINFEKELIQNRPNIVLVVGDVTSTMACTITAKKLCIDVVHVEAGIRSGDMTMPEEINRIVTDSICNHYFTTTSQAQYNLNFNHVNKENIHFVGNVMIDSLIHHIDKIRKPIFFDKNQLNPKKYFLLTLHRPANVDDPEKLVHIINTITNELGDHTIIFPVHPRTRKNISSNINNNKNIILVDPQGYLEFIYLIKHAKGIITDSGGITEEATFLNIPCITLRNSTERPETVELGTNELVGDDLSKLSEYLQRIIANHWKKGSVPELWDGHSAERIIDILFSHYGKSFSE